MMPVPIWSAAAAGVAMLILATLAVTSGLRGRPAKTGIASVFTSTTAYVLIGVVLFTGSGLGIAGLLLLGLVSLVPIAASAWLATMTQKSGRTTVDQGRDDLESGRRRKVLLVASIASGLGLVTIQLTIAGRVLSLVGGVRPYAATIAIGGAVTVYLLATGLRASWRTSRWTMYVCAAIAAVIFVIGALVGGLSDIGSPVIPSQLPSTASIVSLFVAFAVAGAVDPALMRSLSGARSTVKSAVSGGAVTVAFTLAFGFGIMALYGGSFWAPTLQFFALVVGVGVIGSAVLIFLFTLMIGSIVDGLIAAASEAATDMIADDEDRSPIRRIVTVIFGIVAIAIATVAPPIDAVLIGGAIVAGSLAAIWVIATLTAKLTNPAVAFATGVLGAIVVALIAGFGNVFRFDWASVIAIAVAVLLSGVATSILNVITGRHAAPART